MSKVFFIGIGGSGLSAIARLLLERGDVVMGSDQSHAPILDELARLGATIYIGHRAEQVLGADLVIRSAAVPETSPELEAARQHGIPVMKRADFLGDYLRGRFTIAVAGTHGKTTTTAMIAWLLEALQTHPGYLVGGVARNLGRSASVGESRWFVIEADEYDHMFLGLQPDLALITTLEHDHPDLFPTEQAYRQAFQRFAARIQPGGVLLTGPGVLAALAAPDNVDCRVLTYGSSDADDYQLHNLRLQPNGCYAFDAIRRGEVAPFAIVHLGIPGLHNAHNALAALAAVDLLELPVQIAAPALADFSGVERRFEIKAEIHGITLIDDYAHHPTEIRSTLQAARDRYDDRNIIAVWQPHTFTRSQTLFSDFTRAFNDADQVLVMDVYAAREQNPGFTAARLADAMPAGLARYVPGINDVLEVLKSTLKEGDVLIVLSAGSAVEINAQLLAWLQDHQPAGDAPDANGAGANPVEQA